MPRVGCTAEQGQQDILVSPPGNTPRCYYEEDPEKNITPGNTLRCYYEENQEKNMRLLFHPGSLQFAGRALSCGAITTDSDSRVKLGVAPAEAFHALKSSLCSKQFGFSSSFTAGSEQTSLIRTVCSPRALEVMVLKAAIAMSCGGGLPMNLQFRGKQSQL